MEDGLLSKICQWNGGLIWSWCDLVFQKQGLLIRTRSSELKHSPASVTSQCDFSGQAWEDEWLGKTESVYNVLWTATEHNGNAFALLHWMFLHVFWCHESWLVHSSSTLAVLSVNQLLFVVLMYHIIRMQLLFTLVWLLGIRFVRFSLKFDPASCNTNRRVKNNTQSSCKLWHYAGLIWFSAINLNRKYTCTSWCSSWEG